MNEHMEFDIKIQEVKKLIDKDFAQLLAESLEEGFRHIKRLVNDYKDGQNQFNNPGEALFAAFIGNDLVGVCGLNEDPFLDDHKVGRVRRMYVRKEYRRSGAGRKLVEAVIAKATKHFRMIVLHTDDFAAGHFYQSIGFKETSEIPNATHFLEF